MSETTFTIRGYVTKDVSLTRIIQFLQFELQSMICRENNEKTKEVVVDVTIKETI